jgi:MFS family permease
MPISIEDSRLKEMDEKASSEPSIVEGNGVFIDPKEERKLRRKLDMCILPVVTLSYWLMFLDRSNIGNAKSAGLVSDLGLHQYDFNIGTSLYYIVYLSLDIICGLLVKRYGFTLVPVSIVFFGLVTLSQAWMTDRAGFYVTRVFLGISEAFLMPGVSYLLTRYYRRGELTFRYGCFMLIAAGCAGAFGGLMAAGLLSVGKIGSVVGWRNIFLVEGILTMGLGVILVFLFPDDPERTRLFTEEERKLAMKRILIDQPQVTETKEKMDRSLIRRGLLNVNTLGAIWLYSCSNVTVQGLGVFLPSILKVNYPGASNVRIQLLTVPVYVCAMGVTLIITYLCVRLRVHWFFAMLGGLLSIVGYGIWTGTDSSATNVRYAACFLNMIAGFINGPVAVGWGAANASPDTLRAMVGAVVTGFAGIGAVAGVWAYTANTASSGYRPGNIFNLAMGISCVLCAVGLMLYQKMENRIRERGGRDYRLEKGGIDKLGNLHPSYRYIS